MKIGQEYIVIKEYEGHLVVGDIWKLLHLTGHAKGANIGFTRLGGRESHTIWIDAQDVHIYFNKLKYRRINEPPTLKCGTPITIIISDNKNSLV